MNMLDVIQEKVKLNENEKRICEYIFAHIEEVPKYSSRRLAKETYTNATAILRLSRKLGFENYNEFKLNLVRLKDMKIPDAQIVKKENLVSINNRIATLHIDIIEHIRKSVDLNHLAQICDKMNHSPYIDFIATDLNASLADFASHLFFMEGKICNVYVDRDQQIYLGMNAPSDHVVFLISKTGRNKRIIDVAKELKKRHVTSIAITPSKHNLLAKNCQYTLPIQYKNDLLGLGEITFTLAARYLITLLYVMLFSEHYDDVVRLNETYANRYYKQ